MQRALFVGLGTLLVTLGCGDDDLPVMFPDASIDAAPFDAAPFDAATDDGGPSFEDAGADADGMDAGRTGPPAPVSGRVTFERRVLSRRGLEAPVAETLAGVDVILIEGATQLGLTSTATDGSYAFDVEPSGEARVRVLASGNGVAVTDFRDNTYAFEVQVVDGRADVVVDIDEMSGALAIYETMNEGLAFARDAFDRAEAFPELQVYWERGRTTPGGTSYAAGDQLWILGGPSDTDEFDTPVLLHELGHYLQWVYDFYDVVPGNFHNGADTDARLAWGEGWASFFSSAARGTGFYGDSIGEDLAYDLDVEALPLAGEYVCSPAAGIQQTLSEWVITASLYELYLTGDPAEQRQRSFAPIRDRLSRDASDRGLPGVDFVDFIDAYLCNAGGAQDALVEDVIVNNRRFPHDLTPSCKPGDRPGLQRFLRMPPAVSLPGVIARDPSGRSFRVIQVD